MNFSAISLAVCLKKLRPRTLIWITSFVFLFFPTSYSICLPISPLSHFIYFFVCASVSLLLFFLCSFSLPASPSRYIFLFLSRSHFSDFVSIFLPLSCMSALFSFCVSTHMAFFSFFSLLIFFLSFFSVSMFSSFYLHVRNKCLLLHSMFHGIYVLHVRIRCAQDHRNYYNHFHHDRNYHHHYHSLFTFHCNIGLSLLLSVYFLYVRLYKASFTAAKYTYQYYYEYWHWRVVRTMNLMRA